MQRKLGALVGGTAVAIALAITACSNEPEAVPEVEHTCSFWELAAASNTEYGDLICEFGQTPETTMLTADEFNQVIHNATENVKAATDKLNNY